MVTEERLWEEAWLTVMSEELRPEHFDMYYGEAMLLADQEYNPYIAWEPFEHYSYNMLVDTIENFYFQFDRLIKEDRYDEGNTIPKQNKSKD